jgi:putative ABC transport system permease protein
MRDILWLVLRKGVRLSLWAAVLGMAGSAALARLLVSAVPSLQSNSAVAVLGVIVVLVGVALAACGLPAWRATRVDPLVALRQE